MVYCDHYSQRYVIYPCKKVQTILIGEAHGIFQGAFISNHNLKIRTQSLTTPHVQSFVLISMLRGQPTSPPSDDDLAVLDYHLKRYDSELITETLVECYLNSLQTDRIPFFNGSIPPQG